MGTTEDQTYKLYKIVDKAKKVTSDALVKMVSEIGLAKTSEEIFYEYLKLNSFSDVELFLQKYSQLDIKENFLIFVDQIKKSSMGIYLTYDPTIVRGLDYYTGIVFEIYDKHPDNRRALCGGGAYANLLQIFNEDQLSGVGFGLGDVTLRDFLEVHGLIPNLENASNDVFITFQEEDGLEASLLLARQLRKENLKVVTNLEPIKFKKVFPAAEKKGVKFVTIMGTDELSKKQIQLKNLQTKEQHTLDLFDLKSMLKIIKASL